MGLLEEVLAGDVPLHRVNERVSESEAVGVRRRALEEWTDSCLEPLSNPGFDVGRVSDKNVENLVGGIEVPVGVVGALAVEGEYSSGEYRVPLATTEGALVASVNRGCGALTESGGADVVVTRDAMTRAPVFSTSGVRDSRRLVKWVDENEGILREAAEGTTDYGELLWIDPYVAGDNVFLRMGFDTKDAMGMNMATVAAEAACEVVERECGCSLAALSGNMCTDKKPAAINLVEGRGKTVTADVVIPHRVVESKLKTSVEDFLEVHDRKTAVGSSRAATLGINAHAANILSAVYLATGQDPAQVAEGSMGITTCRERDNDLYVSVTLPAVEVGTLGGGTGIAGQKACLDVMDVEGSGDPPGSNSRELAEVISAVVLAGEVSLHAALASRHLSSSHDDLGR